MSKKKTQVHWVNPPNPYHEAYLEAWKNYTDVYHFGAPIRIQERFYKAYEIAKVNYENNPQTIFNDDVR